MIRILCFAAAIACMVGSFVRAESRSEEETEFLLSAGESVSSSFSLTTSGNRADRVPTSVLLTARPDSFFIRSDLDRLDMADWKQILSIQVLAEEEAPLAEVPSISGRYVAQDGYVEFIPRYPFEVGVEYLATFRPRSLQRRLARRGLSIAGEGFSEAKEITHRFHTPRPQVEPVTEVSAVFPSTDRVPENLLKFYLHFSRPMSWGDSYRHIHLFRADGSEVTDPFLRLDEELWDPEGRRMTLLIDPGRIKNGLLPKDQAGPSLLAGERFALVIDANWEDSSGVPLKAGFQKSFQVDGADVERPSMATWKLEVPTAATRSPLRLTFPEPLDHALLERVVWVVDSQGVELNGTIAIKESETVLEFIPERTWTAGLHELCAENSLEDLAGNSLGRLFEIDSFLSVSRRVERQTLKRTFQVR